MDIHFSVIQEVFFFGTRFLFFFFIYLILKIADREFLSNDPRPEIYTYTSLPVENKNNLIFVKTGLFIYDFPVFDLDKSSFSMNATLWFEFEEGALDIDVLSKFRIENARDATISSYKITVKEGRCLVEYRILAEFSCSFEGKYFPMNDHILRIKFTNHHISSEQVQFELQVENGICLANDLRTEDWTVLKQKAETGFIEEKQHIADKVLSSYPPRLMFSLWLKKSGLRKAFLVILPIICILLISC